MWLEKKKRQEKKQKMDDKEKEEDERREAAIASTPSLQPDFKPIGRTLTSTQISKFQELHRRRLAIKSKSKFKNKPKDDASNSHSKKRNTKSCEDEGSSNPGADECDDDKKQKPDTHISPNQRRKLHWGLDAKERWERKANM